MTRMKSTNLGKEPVAIRNTWKRAVAALQFGFPELVLFLALACSSVSSPATSTPPVSTGTPLVEGTIQTPRQATEEEAAPAQGSSQEAVAIPATVSAPTETSEPTPRSNGADGDNQAPSIPYKGGLKYPNLHFTTGDDAARFQDPLHLGQYSLCIQNVHENGMAVGCIEGVVFEGKVSHTADVECRVLVSTCPGGRSGQTNLPLFHERSLY